MSTTRLAALLAVAFACSSRPAPERLERLRFWHVFNTEETEALNRALAAWQPGGGLDVEPIRETFARGQIMFRRSLQDDACPDLARIDATWLPGLVESGVLATMPADVAGDRRWLPETAALASLPDGVYGMPQAIDGLALIHRKQDIEQAGLAWPPATVGELIAGAHTLTGDGRYGLGMHVDGYWFVAFLRAWGGAVVDPDTGRLGIDSPESLAALERFAELFGTVVPPPPPSGTAAEDETRRFRNGTLSIVVNGPWAMAGLAGGDITGIGVAALPGAPLGGQILVVPRCARHPAAAWKLAAYLTSPAIQAEWSRAMGIIPTSMEGLDRAGGVARAFYEALRAAEPLPRHPVTPELFDDLTPAVAAVVSGDSSAGDALEGVARAWSRLLRRHGVEPVPYSPPATEKVPAPHSPGPSSSSATSPSPAAPEPSAP